MADIDLAGYINISHSNSYYFTNACNNDMLIYPETSNQTIHFGITSNSPSAIALNNNSIIFNSSNVFINGKLTVSNVEYITSNIIVYNSEIIQSNLSVYNTSTLCNAVNIYGPLTTTGGTTTHSNLVNIYNPNNLYNAAVGTSNTFISFTDTTAGALNSNNLFLNIYDYRHTAGTDWTGIATRIQKRVDETNQGYIEFNPTNGQHAIAFGTYAGESMRINSNGNLGIGTQIPNAPLHIVSSINTFAQIIDASNSSTGTCLALYQNYTNSTNSNLFLCISGSNNQFSQDAIKGDAVIRTNGNRLLFTTNSGAGSSTMCILPNGNIGIGTTTPTQKLDVSGAINIGSPIADAFLQTPGQLQISGNISGCNTFTNMYFCIGSNNLGTSGSFLWYTGGNVLTGGTQKMSLSSTGILNIASNITVASANINGPTYIYNTNSLSNVAVGTSNTLLKLGNNVGNNSQLFIYDYRHTAGVDWLGVGTRIQKNIDGTANQGYIEFNPSNGAGNISFASSTGEAMRINTSGYVGIATIAPACTLDVNGISAFRSTTYMKGYLYTLNGIVPENDGIQYIGTGTNRYALVYAANGTIQTSDETEKDYTPLTYGLDNLMKISTIKYKWKKQAELPDTDPTKNYEYYGICARELNTLFPELVYNESTPYQINYSELIPVLINSIKELKNIIDALAPQVSHAS